MSEHPERLRWPRRGQFHDHRRDIRVQGPNGTIPTGDLDDDVVERLLDRGFVPVEDDQDGSDPDSDGAEDGDGGADEADDPDELERWKGGFSGKYDVDPDDLDDAGTLPFNPEAKSVPEIRDALQDVDDRAAVRALANLEADQQDRTTASEAFEGRLTELEDDAGD